MLVKNFWVWYLLLICALGLYYNFSWESICSKLQIHHLVVNTKVRNATIGNSCLTLPLCDLPHSCSPLSTCHVHLTFIGRVLCQQTALPLEPTSTSYTNYVLNRYNEISSRYIAGVDAVPVIAVLLKERLQLMNANAQLHSQLVLHFAGDNGVGKTRMAEIISLSLAQRCGDLRCRLGESTLELSGGSYDGLRVREFRTTVIHRIIRHVRSFPRNGVIILNELSLLSLEFVITLLPLLGGSSTFPSHPDVDLRGQIVIITTDFGHEGRTRGKSVDEMREFIHDEFRHLYGDVSILSSVHTFPFLPIALDTARSIVHVAINEIACRENLHHIQISNEATEWLLEHAKLYLAGENGRAVKHVVESFVEPLIIDEVTNMNNEEEFITKQHNSHHKVRYNEEEDECNRLADNCHYVIELDDENRLVLQRQRKGVDSSNNVVD